MQELKTLPEFFQAVKARRKTAEMRKDDREPKFYVGQRLLLKEYDPNRTLRGLDPYTGDSLIIEITHILKGEYALDYGILPGYAMLSFIIVSS